MANPITTAELAHLVSSLSAAASAAETSDSTAEVNRATSVLKQLRKVAVTAAQLKATEAGKKVNKLKKHPSQAIADAAVKVVEAWKSCVKQDSSSQPADQPSSAPAPSASKPDSKPTPAPAAKGSLKAIPPVVKQLTGDQTRDKIRALLAEALALAADSVEDADPAGVAVVVEEALYAQNGGVTAAYKSKYRSVGFNLKDPNNPDLRAKVLIGEIPAQVLVNMTSEEMASDARKQETEKIRDHMKKECERSNNQQASTDQFQCGKCKQKKCTYFQMQTRSADEPMTTFVTCTVCSNKWKFC